MKKLIILLAFTLVFAPAAFAAEITETAQTAAYTPTLLLDEPNKVEELPQPYEEICRQLSNGKEELLKTLRAETAMHIQGTEYEILESIGRAAAVHYAGDLSLGIKKFCTGCLDSFETVEGQVRALAAFVKGYKGYGAAVITGCEGEPVTGAQLCAGKSAWFIPFAEGSTFKVTLLGKEGETAKIWKILRDKPVYKEWKGGFWEREITVSGK